MNVKSTTRATRRAAAVLALTGAVAVGTATAAQAAQAGTVTQNQTRSFSTWFFGRTEVCVKDTGANGTSFNWVSGPSSGSIWLNPGQEYCLTRSFVGLPIYITDVGPSPLYVRFPIGP